MRTADSKLPGQARTARAALEGVARRRVLGDLGETGPHTTGQSEDPPLT